MGLGTAARGSGSGSERRAAALEPCPAPNALLQNISKLLRVSEMGAGSSTDAVLGETPLDHQLEPPPLALSDLPDALIARIVGLAGRPAW